MQKALIALLSLLANLWSRNTFSKFENDNLLLIQSGTLNSAIANLIRPAFSTDSIIVDLISEAIGCSVIIIEPFESSEVIRYQTQENEELISVVLKLLASKICSDREEQKKNRKTEISIHKAVLHNRRKLRELHQIV